MKGLKIKLILGQLNHSETQDSVENTIINDECLNKDIACCFVIHDTPRVIKHLYRLDYKSKNATENHILEK